MQGDKQIDLLQSKVQEQQQHLAKYQQQSNKLRTHISQFRTAIRQNQADATQIAKPNIQKSVQQLQKEIETAANKLRSYQMQLKIAQNKSRLSKAEDVGQLQLACRRREDELKKVRDQLKETYNAKRKIEKEHERQMKREEGSRLVKLLEQVRSNKEQLEGLKQKRKSREEALLYKKTVLSDLQHKYNQKCLESGQKPCTYEEFKLRKKQRRRQSCSETKPIKRKNTPVRDIIHGQTVHQNYQANQKSVIELESKKQLAEQALKVAHRKHEKSIEQLRDRIQTLQIENETLSTRLLQKTKQKQMIDNGIVKTPKNNSGALTTKRLSPIQ